jgi:hypothetical protein
MSETDRDALRTELDDIDETLRRLASETGPPAADATLDGADAAEALTERMEVDAQVEALRRRRDRIAAQLG